MISYIQKLYWNIYRLSSQWHPVCFDILKLNFGSCFSWWSYSPPQLSSNSVIRIFFQIDLQRFTRRIKWNNSIKETKKNPYNRLTTKESYCTVASGRGGSCQVLLKKWKRSFSLAFINVFNVCDLGYHFSWNDVPSSFSCHIRNAILFPNKRNNSDGWVWNLV